MARRSRSTRRDSVPQRGTPRTANRRERIAEEFDDAWLRTLSERQWIRYVDLTQYEDRRRYHPEKLSGMRAGPAPRAFRNKPRIVVVPSTHRLARYAPYGGRVPLGRMFRDEKRVRRRSLEWWTEKKIYYGYDGWVKGVAHSYSPDHFSHRVGFNLPWQVIICVRRRKRREVLFALNRVRRVFSGGRGGKLHLRRRRHRSYWSEVRC